MVPWDELERLHPLAGRARRGRRAYRLAWREGQARAGPPMNEVP